MLDFKDKIIKKKQELSINLTKFNPEIISNDHTKAIFLDCFIDDKKLGIHIEIFFDIDYLSNNMIKNDFRLVIKNNLKERLTDDDIYKIMNYYKETNHPMYIFINYFANESLEYFSNSFKELRLLSLLNNLEVKSSNILTEFLEIDKKHKLNKDNITNTAY